MNLFVLNLFIAFGFAAVMGDFSLTGVATGFAVGYLALWISSPLYGETAYFVRVIRVLRLGLHFLWDLLRSNLRVLWDIVTPSSRSRPGIVGIPLEARTDFEIMLVANLISLTPGSLSLDLSPDRRILYVHFMFLDDVAEARRGIQQGLEKRILEAVR
jgi:multicomponent Na+:H+ antiporter subunit E